MFIVILCLLHLFFAPLLAIDNVHFYRPNFFWGEPRLECPWLTTIDIAVGTGKTTKGYNSRGKETSILNIYGPQNMQVLADNVPDLDPENPLDAILLNLNSVPERDNFGKLKLKGTFKIIESSIDIYQNLQRGFFFELYIPARKLQINTKLKNHDNLINADLSPEPGNIQPNKGSPEWQDFLNNFFPILRRHKLSARSIENVGLGDISFLVGWSCSYQNTIYLDFIDVAAKIGVLFPTSKKQNLNNIFDLPLGYNGHWGAPLKFDISFGLWEWFTCGLHIGSLYLAEKTKEIRMRTSEKQNSFIKLTKGEANIDPGIYFDFDIFAKADHFCKGLSILLAYSFNFKERDIIKPHNQNVFNTDIVNNDSLFAGWNQHVLNVLIEYDFAKRVTDIGARIGFFYNYVIAGKRVFRTPMVGGSIGLDCAWCF